MKAQIARLVNAHEKLFAIDNQTADATYRVCLKPHAVSCSCPHWMHRLSKLPASDPVRQAGCKHVQEVRRQGPFVLAATKAKHLSDAALLTSIRHYQEAGRHEIAGACRVERHQRAQAAAQDAELRSVFS